MATSLKLGMSLQQNPFLIVPPLTLGHGRRRPPQQNCMALAVPGLRGRRQLAQLPEMVVIPRLRKIDTLKFWPEYPQLNS